METKAKVHTIDIINNLTSNTERWAITDTINRISMA